MSLDYALLHRLHLKLRARTDLEERIRKGPLRVKAAEATCGKFTTVLEEAKEAWTKGRLAADQKSLQLSSREAKIEDLGVKLNACKSNKEFSLLKDQIAADKQANSVLSDEILEQLERNDGLESDVKSAEENLAKSQADSKKISESTEGEMVKLKAELNLVLEEITDGMSKLPADLKIDVERLVNAKSEDAFTETDRETCGNCGQQLTAQLKTNLTLSRAVYCRGCGSLMYMTEYTANLKP